MGFPTTQWHILDVLKQDDPAGRHTALNQLVAMYGPPLFALARHRSQGSLSHEDCEDLVNDFLSECLAGELLTKQEALLPNRTFKRDEPIKRKELFSHADRTKGKFRNFIAKSFERYLANEVRKRRAAVRNPLGGVVSLQSLIADLGAAVEPRENETPEDVFERVFLRSMFMNCLKEFEQRCTVAGQEKKYKLFFRHDARPLLDGSAVPTYSLLAVEYDLSSENAVNKIVLAAREEFRALLITRIGDDCESRKEAEVEYARATNNAMPEQPVDL